MSTLLRQGPAATPAMMAVFSDEATIRHALAFESALARAEAAEGVVTEAQAAAIERACKSLTIDPAELAAAVARAGTLAIPLVGHIRAALDADLHDAVHRGATSQDVADTVLMLQVSAATMLLLADANRIVTALDLLADRHVHTACVGRTLLQNAMPVGLGLRFGQWSAGIAAAATRTACEVEAHAVVQFGGAVGTRAGLQGCGAAIAHRLAGHLGLPVAPPWHSRREGLAGIGAAVAILIGTLGKMARDIALLAQNSVDELHEPLVAGRGGSSAMAHKRNPTGCQIALSAAIRAPGLVATLLGGLPQEEERGIGGWQAEGPVIADLFLLAAGAAAAMADVAEGLEIDLAAIERNLKDAAIGDDIGESVSIVAELRARREGMG